MSIYSTEEIFKNAKENSPFYSDLYRDIEKFEALEGLPLVKQDEFWLANTFKENQLLTSKINNGVVFRSGGTTGKPKFSVYTQEEWEIFTKLFGEGIVDAGLKKGDRVANLFYSGSLYASFLFIHRGLEQAGKEIIQFPISGQTDIDEIVSIIEMYEINVLLGVPTSFVKLAPMLKQRGINIDTFLYGGEALFDDQLRFIKNYYPECLVSSIGYASVDGGHLGRNKLANEIGVHQVFEGSKIEIVDEVTGEVIKEVGVRGKLIYTNLTRMLMPIIRYPVGDCGEWSIVGEEFKLLGRSEEGARIGPITLNRDDLVEIISNSSLRNKVSAFQIEINHFEHKDELIIRLCSSVNGLEEIFLNEFYSQREMFKKEIKLDKIHPVKIIFVNQSELITNSRTGKLRGVIDNRI